MKTLLAIVFFLLVSNTVFAAKKSGNKHLAFGFVAGKTCSRYIKDIVKSNRKDVLTLNGQDYYSEHSMYTQWVAGFLSGYGLGVQKAYSKNLNIYYLMLRIEGYCEKNPRAYFSFAANKTILEIE